MQFKSSRLDHAFSVAFTVRLGNSAVCWKLLIRESIIIITIPCWPA